MRDGKVVRRGFTIVEGWNIRDLRAALAKVEGLRHDGEKLDDAALMKALGHAGQHPEGRFLPETYAWVRGDSDLDILGRAHDAMQKALDAAWASRAPDLPLQSKDEALTLASIVEKETGQPSERRVVAGLYSNRLRQGIMLQADPTIIYPITRGKPLGRRIRQSEIQAVNDYNTYTMTGLPKAPITNPGRESIAAVLNPQQTDVLYMVADGSGGHLFAQTLAEHNANVERRYAIRRARGDF